MRSSITVMRLALLIVIGAVAMFAAPPAVAQDLFGFSGSPEGPTPLPEALPPSVVLVSSCKSPIKDIVGLTWDGSHLWISDFSASRAYKIEPSDCSIVSFIPLPGPFPTGLAWDGTYLWNSDSAGDTYYQIDPADGTIVSSFASPGNWPTGLTYHRGDLWGGDIGCLHPSCPDNVYVVSPLGILQNTLVPPGPFPAAMASDGLHIWHTDNLYNTIFKVRPSNFSVLDSFPAPGNHSNDMTWDGRYLWVLENQGDMLYKFDVGVPMWPRSQGFWKHQCSDNGFHQVSDAELDGLMSEVETRSSALSECSPVSCDLFTADGSNSDMRPKALKHLMAAWLNIASDRLYPGTEIALPALTSAATIGDAIAEVEATICDLQASRNELTVAKNIAETLTDRDTDFDLGSNLSVVSVHAGEPGSVTVGLINMSLQTRSYDLAASGPWPMLISQQRVNALAPGAIELITLSAEVPSLAVSGEAVDVRLTAIDRDKQIELQRDLKITFRLPSGGGGSKRVLPVD